MNQDISKVEIVQHPEMDINIKTISKINDPERLLCQYRAKTGNIKRAIPFEKLGEGMSASGFSDYPPPEFPNFWGYPPAESQFFFSYHPSAESTKGLGLPPTCSFCLRTPIFIYKYGLNP